MKTFLTIALSLCLLTTMITLPPPEFSRAVLEAPSARHWLGTDNVGRDVLRAALSATGSTFIAVSYAVATSLVIGVIAGLALQWSAGGWLAWIFRFGGSVLDTVGPLLPAVAFMAIYPRISLGAMGCLLGLLSWPSISGPFSRLLTTLSHESYVIAAKALGGTIFHQLRHHLWFPCARLLLPLCMASASSMIAILTGIEFLGAFSSSKQTIGSLLYESINLIHQAPWYVIGAIFSFAIALTLIFGLSHGFKQMFLRRI